jgi:hypothetical protein
LPDTVALRINVSEEETRAIISVICEEMPRGPRRRTILDREIVIPAQGLELLREVIGDSPLNEIAPAQQQNLFGTADNTLTLREWNDRVRRLPMSRRTEIRKKLQEHPELGDKLYQALRAEKPDQFTVIPHRPPLQVLDGILYLDYFFGNAVKYLGPLRDEPKALYPLAPGVDPSDVGLRGEYTAAVLDLHKTRRVRYIPTSAFRGAELPPKPQVAVRTLETAMLDWLQYLGVAERVETKDMGKFGHELKVVLPGRSQPHDLSHVGRSFTSIPRSRRCLVISSCR